MVDSCEIFLKKQWFIKSKPGKLENSYLFDSKKVEFLKFLKKMKESLLELVHMAG